MPTLTIDGREITVPNGKSILDACRALGIFVPVYCFDPRMEPLGACRVCMVEVKGRRGATPVVPACCTLVRDGMEIITGSTAAMRGRRHVVELLLVHHTLDCPVCDKCGECDLQNYCFDFGISENRFLDEKKDERVDFLHPTVEPYLNRCILCYKCVRICDERVGDSALTVAQRGFDAHIDTNFGGPLDCEACGECIAVCPVGALTSKVFKFGARAWQLNKTETICNYCPVGCGMTLEHFENEVHRVTSHTAQGLNNGILCAKGRFGYGFMKASDRITQPMIRRDGEWRRVSWEEALTLVATRLAEIRAAGGPDAVAGVASQRCTNEDTYVFQKLIRGVLGTNNVDNLARRSYWPARQALLDAGLPPTTLIQDLQQARTIVCLGQVSDVASWVGLEIIRAANNGAQVILISPLNGKLDRYAALSLRVAPGQEAAALEAIAGELVRTGQHDQAFAQAHGLEALPAPQATPAVPGVKDEAIQQAAALLAGGKPAAIAIAVGLWDGPDGSARLARAAANLALLAGNVGVPGGGVLLSPEKNNTVGVCASGGLADQLPGPVALSDGLARFGTLWGARLPEQPGQTIDQLLSSGVRGAWVMGEDPVGAWPDREAAERWAAGLEFLVVQDLFLSETAKHADVFLPAASYAERQGTFTNLEGVTQPLGKAIEPLGNSRPDWEIVCQVGRKLAAALGSAVSFEYATAAEITQELVDAWTAAESATAPVYQLRHNGATDHGAGASAEPSAEFPFTLVTGPHLWVSGSLTWRAPTLRGLLPGPTAWVSSADLGRLGLSQGIHDWRVEPGDDRVTITTAEGAVTLPAAASTFIPPGTVFVPYYTPDGAMRHLNRSPERAAAARVERA